MQAQAGVPKAERAGLQNMELAPVQRKIEARSAEDSFTGFVRTLYFADTFLKDSELLPPLALGDCWGAEGMEEAAVCGAPGFPGAQDHLCHFPCLECGFRWQHSLLLVSVFPL